MIDKQDFLGTAVMIGISAKEAEEKSTEVVLKNRHIVRREYWERVLDAFQKSSCNLYDNISPSNDHWLSAGSGLGGCRYNLIFNKKELRVDLNLDRGVTEENKFLFDFLAAIKDDIEASFGEALEWLRLDDKKSSRIQYSSEADGFNKETWPQSIDWHLAHMSKLERALKTPLQNSGDALKQKNIV